MLAPTPTATRLPPLQLANPATWVRRARSGAAALRRRLAGLTPERLFVLVMVLALVGFFLALLLQPGAVGRGGR